MVVFILESIQLTTQNSQIHTAYYSKIKLLEFKELPIIYPRPKNVCVHDRIVAYFAGKSFKRMLNTAPHAATSAMPPRALERLQF